MSEPTVTFANGRTFDYVPRLVEANNQYLVRQVASIDPGLHDVPRYWIPGRVLDQGREGACVGFAVSAEASASPVRVRGVNDSTAMAVYRRCKEIDEWEGVNYSGTSVRAGMLVGREKGWWTNFYWAKSMDELRSALEIGPVVVGVDWRESMYHTEPNGLVTVRGRSVGKHAILVNGSSPWFRGKRLRIARWRNSWSRSYGINGHGYIEWNALEEILFGDGNEAAVPSDRLLGKGA